ncbi:KUP/HAK/KT family potassium transporter [bacterium]|nr:KUP/HAK/KT family potassium transporter [bacterium]
MNNADSQKSHVHGTVFAAFLTTGIVYGDIGTSVLYAINEIFFGHAHIPIEPPNVVGVISLALWALTLIITVKYIFLILYADHQGEGGVFALFAKLTPAQFGVKLGVMSLLLVLAAGLLYGDGIITPAISVLSAIEGLNVITPAYQSQTTWIAAAALLILFIPQSFGTHRVSLFFSPVMVMWFCSIGILGAMQILKTPSILWALNPWHAMHFLSTNPLHTNLEVLGSIILVVTGGEALFADMGHFGRKPIQVAWLNVVYPFLMLNYLGQGAYLLSGQTVIQKNLFYSMVPESLLYPMVGLATAATVIASQALITGAYSLTAQANALGLLPRFRTHHTSSHQQGQIYLPFVNWSLLAGCLYLVFSRGSSSNLAAAYGLAVSGVMLVTSLAMCFISHKEWGWSPLKVALTFGLFSIIDSAFLFANSLKFMHGGYLPFMIGLALFIVMTTWRKGRVAIAKAYGRFTTKTIDWLIAVRDKAKEVQFLAESGLSEAAKNLEGGRSLRFLQRGSVFMSSRPVRQVDDLLPAPMRIFLKRYGAIAEEIIILHVHIVPGIPFVKESERHEVIKLADGVTSVVCHYGFQDDVKVQEDLDILENSGRLRLADQQWTVEVGENELKMQASDIGFMPAATWLFQKIGQMFGIKSKSARTTDWGIPLHEQAQFLLYRFLERYAAPLYEHFALEGMQISKIVIPVEFDEHGASIKMPDMEIQSVTTDSVM